MSNFIFDNRDSFEEFHYIRKADRSTQYWFSFLANKLNDEYVTKYEDRFCLILIGSGENEDNFILPYNEVKHLFSPDYLDDRNRWVGTVRSEILSIHGSGNSMNVSSYYNAYELIQIDDDDIPSVSHIKEAPANYDLNNLRKKITDFNNQYRSVTPKVTITISERISRPGEITDHIKELQNYTCQICNQDGFIKQNGEKYIEAHHIRELHKLIPGSYCSDNIIVVCPNCHKKLHYANISFTSLSEKDVTVTINGEEFNFRRNIIS